MFNQIIKFTISLEQQIWKQLFQNRIRPIGLTKFMKLQKLLVIQYETTKTINLPTDVTKPC